MPSLTTSQYERLRNLVRRSPVFTGMRIVMHDDHVEVVEPHELEIGFLPLADHVRDAPADRWPELLDKLLEGVVSSLIHGEPELDGPTDQVLGRIYPRLKELDRINDTLSYAPVVAPDLRLLFGFDLPDRIAILNDNRVARHGFYQLYDAAVDNLCGELPAETMVAPGDICVLEGSDYVASLVMVLPWVADAAGVPELPYGALVAMPNHNRLIYHVLRDGPGTRHALSEIARRAAEHYAEDPVPLSPRVYWFRPEPGPLEIVAEYVGEGHGVIGEDVVTYPVDDFAAVLADLELG